MCSSQAARLTLIGEAIDRLAAETANEADSEPGAVAGRIAAIWDMVAEADPELASRLRDYTDPGPGAHAARPEPGGS